MSKHWEPSGMQSGRMATQVDLSADVSWAEQTFSGKPAAAAAPSNLEATGRLASLCCVAAKLNKPSTS